MQYNSLRLELTGCCDFKCLYCHAGQKNTKDYQKQLLTHKRILQLVDEAKSLGVKNFIFTGGEPFLNSRWDDIAIHCGTDARIVISTNGNHFSGKNLQKLKKLPQIREFRTSIDGLKTNDIIRDGSSYKKSIESIKRLKKVIPDSKIMIQTVLYKQNITELFSLYKILKELKINRWRISQLWKTIKTEKNKNIVDFSDYDLMFDIYKKIIRQFQKDKFPFRLGIDNVYDSWITKEDYIDINLNSHPCSYQFDYLCINANGDIIFCPALNIPIANCKTKGIKHSIEESKWLDNFKKTSVKSLSCGNCRYIKICGGGCRADALKWLGKIQAIDLNSCCMMTKVEKEIMPLLTKEEQIAYQKLINFTLCYPNVKGANIKEVVNNYKKEVI